VSKFESLFDITWIEGSTCQIQYPIMKLLAASKPSEARTFTPSGSRPVTGSKRSIDIHFSRLKVTWEIIGKPPHTFWRKNARYSGEVDQDSRLCQWTDTVTMSHQLSQNLRPEANFITVEITPGIRTTGYFASKPRALMASPI
jgi:hypothetical protein